MCQEVNILNSFMFLTKKKKKANSLMNSCLSFSTVNILNVSSVNNLESIVALQHRVQTLKHILKEKKRLLTFTLLSSCFLMAFSSRQNQNKKKRMHNSGRMWDQWEHITLLG